MVEVIEVLANLTYFVAGALVGVLTSLLSYVLQEKIRVRKRRKEIANLVINDIGGQLVQINEVETHILPSLKKPMGERGTEVWMQSIRLFASIYSENRFLSLLPQLPILPPECQRFALAYYKLAEFLSNDVCWGIDHRDKDYVINCWDAFANIVRHAGYSALASLYGSVLKDTSEATTMLKEAEDFSKKIKIYKKKQDA